MVLRRIAEHLRKQEWTAIAIDFVIVVVGVFLATQVANWNEERIEQARAREVTARLLVDVRDEARNFKNVTSYYEEVLENAKRAAAILDDGAPASDEVFLIAAYRASQYFYYTHSRAVYDELLSTGEIGIVTDPFLRASATLMFNTEVTDEATRLTRASEYRQIFRRAVPASLQLALREHCGDRAADRQQARLTLGYACAIGAPPRDIAAAAATLRRAPGLGAALRQRVADVDTAVSDMTSGDPTLLDRINHYAGNAP